MIIDILIKLRNKCIFDTSYSPSRFIMHPRIERSFKYELNGIYELEYMQTKKFMGIPIETDENEKNIRCII